MINKHPEEQPMRRYRYRATASVSRPLIRRGGTASDKVRRQSGSLGPTKSLAAQQTLVKRKVTMPHEAIQPLSWAERHKRFRQPTQSTSPRLVARTLSQTGRPAPVGRLRASRPLPRSSSRAAVPARQRRQRNRSFWGKFLGFLAVLAVIVGGVSFALASSTFHVQHLTVTGTQNRELIASIKDMGIQDQNVFFLNKSALAAQLERWPLVASASLAIQLPDTVLVNVQERMPVLLWQSGQKIYAVAQDGMVIAEQSKQSDASGLTMVVDKRSNVQVRPGTRFSAQNILFAEQLFQQLPDIQGIAPFALQYVDKILVDGRVEPANEGNGGSYVVVASDGWQAYLGDETNDNSLANRLLELQQILNLAKQQHLVLATIDVRFGLRPTYTLKS